MIAASNHTKVSLVIPGRNSAEFVDQCLMAAVARLGLDGLNEIIFVDDGSTDNTAEIVRKYPVTCIRAEGRGPGAAWNTGWRAAKMPLVWFIDSDCVIESGALSGLLSHLADSAVAGVGGSYSNMRPDSSIATLIHEEIVERHRLMSTEVNRLATFNVVYRRRVLEEVGGFDESLKTAEDADLAFRLRKSNYRLQFEFSSKVKHFHASRLGSYLRAQARRGFYRMRLYYKHPSRMTGDSYSRLSDHIQPPIAILALLSAPLAAWPRLAWIPAVFVGVLAVAQAPFTMRLIRRTRSMRMLLFAPLSFVRAFWRGAGMVAGLLSLCLIR